MSSPYSQKVNLKDNSDKRKKLAFERCFSCKETNKAINFLASKVDRVEKIVKNLEDISSKNKTKNDFSKFSINFCLNNIPCELEYNLSSFSLENLQKLAVFTVQIINERA